MTTYRNGQCPNLEEAEKMFSTASILDDLEEFDQVLSRGEPCGGR